MAGAWVTGYVLVRSLKAYYALSFVSVLFGFVYKGEVAVFATDHFLLLLYLVKV